MTKKGWGNFTNVAFGVCQENGTKGLLDLKIKVMDVKRSFSLANFGLIHLSLLLVPTFAYDFSFVAVLILGYFMDNILYAEYFKVLKDCEHLSLLIPSYSKSLVLNKCAVRILLSKKITKNKGEV